MNPRWRWDQAEQKWRVFFRGESWTMRNPESWRFFLRDLAYIAIWPELTQRVQ